MSIGRSSTPTRLAALGLLVALGGLGCKTAPSAESGSETTGDGDGDGGDDGLAFAAGSRLRPIVIGPDADATVLVAWYDTQLETECAYLRASDGVERCLPYEREHPDYATGRYADPDCTQEVTVTPCGPAKYALTTVLDDDGCDSHLEVRPVTGEAESGPVYSRDFQGECFLSFTSVRAPVGEVMDPSAFVAGVEQLDAVDPVEDRIAGVRRVGDDGSWAYVGARDLELDAAAHVAKTADGRSRWIPRAPEFDTEVFSDESCSEPAAVDRAWCPPDTTAYVAEVVSNSCGSTTTTHEGGAALEQVYGWTGEEGQEPTCTASMLSGPGYYPVGPAITDETFAEAPLAVVGDGQTLATHWLAGDDASAAFAGWTDAVHGLPCQPLTDSEGVLRCLPIPTSIYTGYFTNAECAGEPVAILEDCQAEPPPFIVELSSADEECPNTTARHLVRAIGDAIDPTQTEFFLRDPNGGSCFAHEPQTTGRLVFATTLVDPVEFGSLSETTL